MSERRSGRCRKQVDYSKFAADIDNDDDFADSTPPPPKKLRTAEKSEGRKANSKSSKTSLDKPAPKKNRLPLDDKLYERDLQAALELSMQDSQSEASAGEQVLEGGIKAAVLHSTPLPGVDKALHERDLEPGTQTLMPSAIPAPQIAGPPSHSVEHSDDIEFLGTVACSDSDSPVKRRQNPRQKQTHVINDDGDDDESSDDFSEDAVSSDSDFDGADSDFDDSRSKSKSKTKGKVKGAPANKKSAATEKKSSAPLTNKSKAASTKSSPAPAQRTAPTPASAPKPVSKVKSPVSTAVKACPATTPSLAGSRASIGAHKAPAWTPPGRSDSSNTGSSLKSPSSGLRLGLSRRASIKPLHPSLKVS